MTSENRYACIGKQEKKLKKIVAKKEQRCLYKSKGKRKKGKY